MSPGQPGREGRAACGYFLPEAEALSIVGGGVLAAQAVFDRALQEKSALVAGERVSSMEFFSHARALYGLLLHHGEASDLPALPARLFRSLERYYASRDELRMHSPPDDERKRPATVYRRRLTDIDLTAALAPRVASLLGSSSWDELSMALEDVAGRVYRHHGRRMSFQSYYGLTPSLNAALVRTMPQRHRLVWVMPEADRVGEASEPDEIARQVPAMLWPEVWEESFQHLMPKAVPWKARRFLSMLLVKLQAGCTWDAAGTAFGFREAGSRLAMGYINRAIIKDTPEALCAGGADVIGRLRASSTPVDYGYRRHALKGLRSIEKSVWSRLLEQAGGPDADEDPSYSVIWLWSELTGGFPPDAPGWRDTSVEAAVRYRAFVDSGSPDRRAALLDHGRELLAQVGDAQPERAELILA